MQLNTSAWNRCTNWKNHGITSSRKYLPDHVCPSHVKIAQLISVTVLSLQTRLCFLSVTSLSLHRTRTRVSVPLLSLQCAIVTWQTLCNDSNSSTQVCDGNSEIGHMLSWWWSVTAEILWSYCWWYTHRPPATLVPVSSPCPCISSSKLCRQGRGSLFDSCHLALVMTLSFGGQILMS